MIRILLFALVALMQLSVPAYMIREAERTLTEGEVMRFRTAPVDPADLFRGRYVRLDFEPLHARATDETPTDHGRIVYAVFDADPEGFARVAAAYGKAPESGNYMAVRVWGYDAASNELKLSLPVDRLYMEERLAPLAEREYARLRDRKAWAELRVRKGHALIEQVFIDGVPLDQIARAAAEVPD